MAPAARARPLRWLIAALVATLSLLMLEAVAARAAVDCSAGTAINIVAHPDDGLLFLSPDVLHDVQAGKCVRTVFVTAGAVAGDAGALRARESGVKAAYAQMAGVGNAWTATDAGVSGHPIPLLTLTARPTVSLVFIRLPEGIWGSTGTPQDTTIQNLWLGNIGELATLDGSSTYTKSGLTSTLTALLTSFQPQTIRAQDYRGGFGDGDHADHHAAAYFAQSASTAYAPTHTFIGYIGYPSKGKPENVSGADLAAKTDAFYSYLQWDVAPCGAPPDCGTNDYSAWLKRQYTVGDGGGTGGSSGGPTTSFTNPAAGQTIGGAIDVAATADDTGGPGVWLTAFRVDSARSDPVAVDYQSPWGFRLDTTKLAAGQHTLYVRAADTAGVVGPDATVTFTVDNSSGGSGGGGNVAPITSFTNPIANQTVSGTINVAATAQDQSGTGIWLTVFRVDSADSDPVAVDYGDPYGFTLDTRTLTNGLHTLYVRAEDNALNIGADATVTFNVQN